MNFSEFLRSNARPDLESLVFSGGFNFCDSYLLGSFHELQNFNTDINALLTRLTSRHCFELLTHRKNLELEKLVWKASLVEDNVSYTGLIYSTHKNQISKKDRNLHSVQSFDQSPGRWGKGERGLIR